MYSYTQKGLFWWPPRGRNRRIPAPPNRWNALWGLFWQWRYTIVGIQTTRNPQTVTKRRWLCSGSSRHNLHRCARSEGASGSCSSSLVSMIGVCVRKDVKVGLVDGCGGRRGGNWSRNEENTTFKTHRTALSAAALPPAHNASRVRGAVNEQPYMEGRTARRPPVNGTSPKTSSAGLALLLLAKKERRTPADWRLASSLRRAPGRRPRWFDDMPGA